MSGIERRKFRRAIIVTEVELMSGGEKWLAPTRDISAGGLFLKTTNAPPPGTQVRLRFHLEPEKPAIEALGQVLYLVRERGAGIEFIDLSPESRSRIESFVTEAAADQPPPEPLLPV